jgi:hypothetical protein
MLHLSSYDAIHDLATTVSACNHTISRTIYATVMIQQYTTILSIGRREVQYNFAPKQQFWSANYLQSAVRTKVGEN